MRPSVLCVVASKLNRDGSGGLVDGQINEVRVQVRGGWRARGSRVDFFSLRQRLQQFTRKTLATKSSWPGFTAESRKLG